VTASSQLPWVIFSKADRSRSVIVMASSYPAALKQGAARLRINPAAADYAPVLDGEGDEGAKKRVAEMGNDTMANGCPK
jgi:hypothetical protein